MCSHDFFNCMHLNKEFVAVVCFVSKNPEVEIRKLVGTRLGSTNVQRGKSSGLQISVGFLPTTTQRKRSGDSCSGSVFRQFPSNEYQQNGELAEAIGIPSSDVEQIRGEKRRLLYRRPNAHVRDPSSSTRVSADMGYNVQVKVTNVHGLVYVSREVLVVF